MSPAESPGYPIPLSYTNLGELLRVLIPLPVCDSLPRNPGRDGENSRAQQVADERFGVEPSEVLIPLASAQKQHWLPGDVCD